MFKPRPFTQAFPHFFEATEVQGVKVPPFFSLHIEDVLTFAVVTLREGQLAERNVQQIFAVSRAIFEDLKALEEEVKDEDRETRILQFVRFIVSQAPLSASMSFGLSGQAHDWFYQGISADHDPTYQLNEGYGFWPIRQEGDSSIAVVAIDLTTSWLANLYLLARTTTGVSKPAERFLEQAWEIVQFELDHRPNREASVLAAAAMLSWAVQVGHPKAEAMTQRLLRDWDGDAVPRPLKPIIGQVFCTDAADYSPRTAQEWARLLLDDFSSQLREHQRLQLLSVSIRTAVEWKAAKSEILDEVRRLSTEVRDEATKISAPWLFTLESRIEVINPLVHKLINFGDHDGLLDLLFVWYGRGDTLRCDGDVLVVCASYAAGTAYLWPGGRWVAPEPRPLAALNAALDAAFTEARDVEVLPTGWSEQRAGLPAFDQSPALEDAIRSHYQTRQLKIEMGEGGPFRSLLAYPALKDAASAIIADGLGQRLAIESSLGRAAPARSLRRLAVWPDRTYTTHLELACIEEAGRRGGFDVRVVPISDQDDLESFARFYEDEDADLLWVIGHGQFKAHEPHASGLQLSSDRILPGDALGRLHTPGDERRLLFLNVCSGAEAQGTGGLGRIGLAPELVRANQAVVAHRWAVDGMTALAFGALTAAGLAEERAPEDAVFDAIEGLKVPSGIVDRLRAALGNLEVLERLRPEAMGGMLNWACPALLT